MASTALSLPFSPSALLHKGPARIPTAGKIRAGIKVLTPAAARNQVAKSIYEHALAENLSFEEITKKIIAAVPGIETPLVPKNVQYFTVRPCDFPNPEVAKQILAKYGEDRGEGVRLYRFPVVFAADSWQTVMPHDLTTWGTSGKKYWSAYSPDGKTRSCLTYEPASFDQQRRVIRLFGGRKHILRPDNNGICNPERCLEYQNRQCNLSGRLIFYIPGIKSISAIEIPTNSFYAMNNAIQKFETIAFMRGGRISGYLDSDRTPFYITKKQVPMSRVGNDGKVSRVKQWIIELEAPVDVAELLRSEEDDSSAVNHAGHAVQLLEPVHAIRQANPQKTSSSLCDIGTAPVRLSSKPGDVPLAEITLALERMGIDVVSFQKYADARYGAGWKLNQNGRRRILGEIEGFDANPKDLQDLVSGSIA